MAKYPNVVGLDDLKKRLEAARMGLSKIVGREVKDGARAIVAEAKQRAPADQGTLRQQITLKVIDELNYEPTSGAEYSPYLEFGTLEKVSVPAELQEYAAQFKGNFSSGRYSEGGGLTAKEAIYAWCKRKGIDKELWYPIYISIMVHGIEPRPFFYPAVLRIKPIIIENVKKVLADFI